MIARLCLFLFLGLGLVVSFEDWSHRRIRNRGNCTSTLFSFVVDNQNTHEILQKPIPYRIRASIRLDWCLP